MCVLGACGQKVLWSWNCGWLWDSVPVLGIKLGHLQELLNIFQPQNCSTFFGLACLHRSALLKSNERVQWPATFYLTLIGVISIPMDSQRPSISSNWRKVVVVQLHFLKIYLLLRVWMFLCVCVCTRAVACRLPVEGIRSPLSWSSWRVWAPWCE